MHILIMPYDHKWFQSSSANFSWNIGNTYILLVMEIFECYQEHDDRCQPAKY